MKNKERAVRDTVRTWMTSEKATRFEKLVALGPPAIPYLLEALALTYRHSIGLVSMAALVLINKDLCSELVVPGQVHFLHDRFNLLSWGRRNRYLPDWLCPDCHLGYDAHIGRPCGYNSWHGKHTWAVGIRDITVWNRYTIKVGSGGLLGVYSGKHPRINYMNWSRSAP